LGLLNEVGSYCAFKHEGEDQTVQISSRRLLEDFEPHCFSQFDERLAAELKDRQDEINREVIVEDSEASKLS
jgi:hypothetical protein